MGADSKSSLVQIAQNVLDETLQALKVVNVDPDSGGATEITAQEILDKVTSIDDKTPVSPATTGKQDTGNTYLGSLDGKIVTFNLNTGFGTENVQGVTLRTSSASGSLEAGTVDNPWVVGGNALGTAVALPLSSVGGGNYGVVVTGSIAVSSSALPTGAATSAKQDTGNTSLSSIDGKTPALGQALAAASVPVVLTAAQISTLTPQTNALTDTQLRASAVPVSASQTGTWNITNISGTISLPTGAATSANQTTANSSLSSLDTKAVQQALNFGAASGAVRVAAIVGNASGVADFGAGAVSSATQRVELTTESKASTGVAAIQLVSSSVKPFYQDFSSVNLTTTYTQVVASTGSTINFITAVNNSGTPIYISTGAAASEVVQYILMPGEATGKLPLQIASGTRIAIRSLTGTISTGAVSLNVFA